MAEETAASYQPKAVKDIPPHHFIKAYAAHLKATDKLQIPDWVDIVKTAPHKELPPLDKDWYYIRAAAIARQIYYHQGLGVGGLRKKFGSAYRDAVRPEHHARAAGGVIRHILQQFEACGFVEKHGKGRRITPSGQKDMDLIAGRVQYTPQQFFV